MRVNYSILSFLKVVRFHKRRCRREHASMVHQMITRLKLWSNKSQGGHSYIFINSNANNWWSVRSRQILRSGIYVKSIGNFFSNTFEMCICKGAPAKAKEQTNFPHTNLYCKTFHKQYVLSKQVCLFKPGVNNVLVRH